MDFSNLEYFQKLYQYRSFSGAAESIPMTVQGLRKAIRAFENELGTTLYLSTKNGIQITNAGERLYRFSLDVLPLYDSLLQDIRSLNQYKCFLASIGFSFGAFGLFAPRFLDQAMQLFSVDKLFINSLPEYALLKELQLGSYDFAVTWGENDPVLFQYTPIAQVPLFAVLTKDHPLVEKNDLTLLDLQNETLISVGSLHKPHNLLVDACLRRGFQPNVTYSASEMSVTLTYIQKMQGIGFALAHECVLYPTEEFSFIPLSDFTLPIGITCLNRHHFTEEELTIIELLRKTLYIPN